MPFGLLAGAPDHDGYELAGKSTTNAGVQGSGLRDASGMYPGYIIKLMVSL